MTQSKPKADTALPTSSLSCRFCSWRGSELGRCPRTKKPPLKASRSGRQLLKGRCPIPFYLFFLPRERGHSGEELSFWGRTVVVADTPSLSQCHRSQVSRFRITPAESSSFCAATAEFTPGMPPWGARVGWCFFIVGFFVVFLLFFNS